MFTNDDTRTVNANAPKSANANKNNKGEKIKMATATVAGAALGGTAAMAATALGEEVEITPEEQPYDEPIIDEQEVIAEETEQQEQEQPAPEPKPEPKPEQEQNSFFRDHKVQIEKIETVTADDGTVTHAAVGTVDGDRALFIDDGQGNVRISIVDENNNGTADDNEVQELANQNIRISDLAEHMQTPAEQPNVTPASNTGGGTTESDDSVRVISVREGVDTADGKVDVAALIVEDTPVMMLDANRDGYADAVAIDENHNGEFDNNEIHDVQGQQFVMPTQANVEGNPLTAQIDPAEDGLPDYSNDADITAYQV